MHPVQFEAICDRQIARREHDELMLAQLTAAVVNTSLCHPAEPVRAKDFMPLEWARTEGAAAKPAPARKKRLSKRQHQEIANSFRRMTGGVRA